MWHTRSAFQPDPTRGWRGPQLRPRSGNYQQPTAAPNFPNRSGRWTAEEPAGKVLAEAVTGAASEPGKVLVGPEENRFQLLSRAALVKEPSPSGYCAGLRGPPQHAVI